LAKTCSISTIRSAIAVQTIEIRCDTAWLAAELIALLEKVTPEDVKQVAQEFFQPERIAASVVGNLDGFELTSQHLAF
jgi:hypothetical protein